MAAVFLVTSFTVVSEWNSPPANASQLSDLQNWYTSMDAANGKRVALFPNDISYLTLDTSSYSSNWPSWMTLNTNYWWPVNSTTGQNYYVTMSVNAPAGSVFRFNDGANNLDFTVPYSGMNQYQMGTIYIPAGDSQLNLTLLSGTGSSVKAHAVELVPSAAKSSIDADIATFHSRPSWLKNAPMGMMFQWGEWGQNADGSHAAWPGAYANMNWANFAQKVKDAGADYVVWSVNWTDFNVAAPISAIDAVLPGRTTTNFGGQDYLMTVVDELRNRGIKVIFYYHAGWDESNWWNPMYVNDLPNGNNARKENFMNRWLNIITEMGNRYGTKLDGWMFDYTNSYMPGPFKMMANAALQGNPNRMITYNCYGQGGHTPAYTPYMDYYMGEDYSGDPGSLNQFGVPAPIVDGKFTDGPFNGVQAFANFPVENGGSLGGWGIATKWGVDPNIYPKYSQSVMNNIGVRAALTKQSMAFDVQMWENGDIAQATLDEFKIAAAKAHAAKATENDTSANVSYNGAGWYTATSPYLYNSDYHETTVDGNYAQFAFTGTGVDFITNTGTAYGNVDIYLDSVLQKTVNLNAASYSYQQVMYSNTSLPYGSHTLKIVKRSGTYMPVDAFNVFKSLTGTYYEIVNKTNGRVLNGGGGSDGNPVSEWTDGSSSNLQWEFIDLGNGYYTIKNRTNGRVLNGGGGYDGYPVSEWTNGASTNLQWQVIPIGNGYYTITNRTDGKVLNGGGGYDGYGVTEWTNGASTNLQWQLKIAG